MTPKEAYHHALVALITLYTAADEAGNAPLAASANAATVALLDGLSTSDRGELSDRSRERFERTIAGLGR